MNEGPPEAWCWERLRSLRWPVRVSCPRCDHRTSWHYRRRYVRYYRCRMCTRMFSDLTNTPFEGTRLPLARWFQAVAWLMTHEAVTARGLAEALGLEQRTANRIMQRLADVDRDPLLRSIGTSVLCWVPDHNSEIGMVIDTMSETIL